ncbi:MAG: ABC transporter ATP-binding protein [Verrucomicrobiia bacterium]
MIETQNIVKGFGRQRVLDGISIKIERGESVAIIGRSGCGKSVLLKTIIGLIQPDSGRVIIDGQDITNLNERQLIKVRRKFGMLFQGAALFDSMNVYENIAFPLRREGRWSEEEIKKKVQTALEMVELPGVEAKMPSELSGGMRKRVGLARAIVYQPEIVLYDEPTTGLDPVVSDSIDKLILRICERLNVTSVMVTHDMRSVRRVSKKIFMLHNGKVHITGTPEEIFNSTDHIVKQFVNGESDPKEVLFL